MQVLVLVALMAMPADGGVGAPGLASPAADGGADATPSPAAPAPVKAPDLVLRPTLDKTKGNVGDIFTYTLRITHPPSERYLVPAEPKFDPFELKGREFFRRVLEDGKVEETFLFRLAVYKTGLHRIPTLEIPYVSADARTLRAVAQDVDVTIESLLPPGREIPPLKDVRPPIPVLVRDWRLLYAAAILGGLLLAALLGWGAYRYGKKLAARPRPAPPPPPPRPAHLIAYEKLAKVVLPTTDAELRRFYETVTDIVREYFGHRYCFLALDMTTAEILKTLKPVQAPGLVIGEVSGFLSEADLVKFAKYVPDAHAPERHLAEARRLIEATREPDQVPERKAA